MTVRVDTLVHYQKMTAILTHKGTPVSRRGKHPYLHAVQGQEMDHRGIQASGIRPWGPHQIPQRYTRDHQGGHSSTPCDTPDHKEQSKKYLTSTKNWYTGFSRYGRRVDVCYFPSYTLCTRSSCVTVSSCTPVHQYTSTPVHQYTSTLVQRYTSTSGTPVHQYTSTLVHRYTGTPVHWYTSAPVHWYTGTPRPLDIGTVWYGPLQQYTMWQAAHQYTRYTRRLRGGERRVKEGIQI